MTDNKDKLEINEEINAEEKEEVSAVEEQAVEEEKAAEEKTEEAVSEEKEEEAAEEENTAAEPEEEVKVYTPHEKEAPALISEKKEPEIGRKDIAPAVQYRKSMEREKKIAQEVKKRQRRPMVLILAMCVVLIILAIIVNALMKDLSPNYSAPIATEVPTQQASPQPQVTQAPQPVVVATPVPTELSYEVYVEDISWEAARDKCAQMGGRLAVINDQAEFEKVMEAVEGTTANKLWVGCYKYDGALIWLDGEASSYYPWAANEPSGYDSYDGAAEDYVMLWKYDDGWKYNDSRNDPAGDFPQWYSGTIGYVCEYK